MTLPGETVGTGAPGPDEDNRVKGPQVMQSAAGYYIGYSYLEDEGWESPYSRESGYYATHDEAAAVLPSFVEPDSDEFNPHARDTAFNG